ncbi:hypothetical protein Scep_009783 [Stephania cephalantha]|uniref:Uncharacterized protein n=1 Tax=Stephania cephalantha TaxID=152367 RepID=A0AAP0JWA4_9MAGN
MMPKYLLSFLLLHLYLHLFSKSLIVNSSLSILFVLRDLFINGSTIYNVHMEETSIGYFIASYTLKFTASSSTCIVNIPFETSIFALALFKNGFPKIREVLLEK